MKTHPIVTFSLLAAILLVGCAPAATPAPAQPEAQAQPAALATEEPQTLSVPTPTEAVVIPTEAVPAEAPSEAPQPVATSRGDSLEATDPANVSLASGELQLVEFFRFT